MRLNIWIPLLLGVLVAGCAGNVKLTHHEISPVYDSGEFAYAGAGRDLRVVVAGNPFGGDQTELGGAVTGYMKGNHWGPATNFTTTPGESVRDTYYVVMLFNPPKTLPGIRLCREQPSALPTEARANGVELFGAFCRRNESLTEIKGFVAEASGPADANFKDLVAGVTQGLFPPQRRTNDSRRRCRYRTNC